MWLYNSIVDKFKTCTHWGYIPLFLSVCARMLLVMLTQLPLLEISRVIQRKRRCMELQSVQHNTYSSPATCDWQFVTNTSLRRTGIAQSVQRLATGLTVRGLNPVCCEVFRTRSTWPWSTPRPMYNGYRIFPGMERPLRGVDQPTYLALRLMTGKN
jgi:hypothetical protein